MIRRISQVWTNPGAPQQPAPPVKEATAAGAVGMDGSDNLVGRRVRRRIESGGGAHNFIYGSVSEYDPALNLDGRPIGYRITYDNGRCEIGVSARDAREWVDAEALSDAPVVDGGSNLNVIEAAADELEPVPAPARGGGGGGAAPEPGNPAPLAHTAVRDDRLAGATRRGNDDSNTRGDDRVNNEEMEADLILERDLSADEAAALALNRARAAGEEHRPADPLAR